MDSSNNGASGGRWRSSTTSDERHDSLDHEIQAELTVADGFRPTDSSSSPPQPSTPPQQSFLQLPPVSNNRSSSPSPSQASSSSTRPSDTQPTSQSTSSPPLADLTTKNTAAATRSRPSSISKVHRPHGSLTLRNDGSSGGRPRLADNSSTPAASSVPTIRTDNGSSQHSHSAHPYEAYGQGSQTSTSGTGDSHREGDYNGPRGPTHPYSLYPQTTAPMEDTNSHEIPVGFTGMGATYSRQLGPDGEDAGDLIGSDGHVEELPPYTRYPDQAYLRRAPASADPSSTTPAAPSPQAEQTPASASAPEQSQLTGAGGLGIATRNPEFSSTEEDLPAGYATSRSAEMSSSDITVITRDFAEKLPTGKWQRRARKKLFGVIPYWAICLLVLGLVLVGIVMGAVLGILLSDKDEKKPDGDESGATSEPRPSADVDFLPTVPDSLPPLATGLFDLPPLDTSQAPRLCFNDTTQAQSWSCEMPLRSYSMEIGLIQNASKVENYEIELEAINGSKKMYVWGTQPPNVPDPVPLRLVNDTFEPARGPAWWREIVYDKTVIVSESKFTINTEKRDWTYTGPRHGAFDPTRFMTGKPGPSNGEMAWICTWPNVTMEIFIYPSQNSSLSFPDIPTSTESDPPSPSATEYDPTPAYPHVVKFLERRLYQDNDATAAFCRKVKVNDKGDDSDPVLDDDGEPIVVTVTEKLNTQEEVIEQSERSRHPNSAEEMNTIIRRETLELTDCGCLWWST